MCKKPIKKKLAISIKGLAILLFEVLLITGGLLELRSTTSYFSVYFLLGIMGGILGFIIERNKISRVEYLWIIILSSIFSIMIISANYELFTPIINRFAEFIPIILSCFIIVRNFIIFYRDRNTSKKRVYRIETIKPKKVFIFSFLCLSIIDLLYLLFLAYPGNMSQDSVIQIGEAMTHITSNHHPFYHTLLIKIVLKIGIHIFNDVNLAIACYSLLQLIIVCAAFSFSIMTLHQIGVSLKWCIFLFFLFALAPYNISYSVTMWKDILFAAGVLVFLISEIRICRAIGKNVINYLLLVVGAIVVCLFRSNGWIALFLTFLVSIIIRSPKRTIIMIAATLVGTLFLKHTVLEVLKVQQPDIAEYLSIPEQQIARCVVEDAELSSEEYLLLAKIADLDRIKSEYIPWLSDPIKNNIRETGIDVLAENKMEYLKLWIKLGIRYPKIYYKAWIDQTKGYWNGGYNYWKWFSGIRISQGTENNPSKSELIIDRYHIASQPIRSVISDMFSEWFRIFNSTEVFEPFMSIGFCVWLYMFALVIGILYKRKELIIVCIPVLAVVLTLWISTPLFSEFRYAYAVFVSVPFIIGLLTIPISITTCYNHQMH